MKTHFKLIKNNIIFVRNIIFVFVIYLEEVFVLFGSLNKKLFFPWIRCITRCYQFKTKLYLLFSVSAVLLNPYSVS